MTCKTSVTLSSGCNSLLSTLPGHITRTRQAAIFLTPFQVLHRNLRINKRRSTSQFSSTATLKKVSFNPKRNAFLQHITFVSFL